MPSPRISKWCFISSMECKDSTNTIARICDWNFSLMSYRINGVLVPEMSLMLFDLNEAVTMV